MDYYRVLNFDREPFSNSPDPDTFYRSQEHADCLQKLELSIRTRRGLSVVIGDVGTGKTTLCRHLLRNLDHDEDVQSHLILDPFFSSPTEFLTHIAGILGIETDSSDTDWHLKERIKDFLFAKGVEDKETILLIIDEGQKAPEFCLELLREFLNYETNEHKLLQIVVFAQKEFESTLDKLRNFADRISLYHYLPPLTFAETKALINHRLSRAAAKDFQIPRFTFLSYFLIYRITRGYPRKIINLCHQILLALIIQNQTTVGWRLTLSSAGRIYPVEVKSWHRTGYALMLVPVLLVATISVVLFLPATPAPDVAQLEPEPRFPTTTVPAAVTNQASSRRQASQQSAAPPPTILESASVVADSQADPANNSQAPDLQASQERVQTQYVPIAKPPAANSSNPQDAMITSQQARRELPLETRPDISKTAEVDEGVQNGGTGPWQSPMLGMVAIGNGETISDLIRQIYGPRSSMDPEVVARVMAANPSLSDPDRISAGQRLLFPHINRQFYNDGILRVQLARFDDLQAANDYLLGNSNILPRMLLIPGTYNNQELLSVVLEESFSSEDVADQRIRELPLEVASNAIILFPADTPNRN